jgi:large subunit ribosomal protein L25
MAGEIPDLIAEARAGTGKGAARQARRDGMVPGVVYGGGEIRNRSTSSSTCCSST